MTHPNNKKSYEPPQIIHEEILEAIATTCDSQFDGLNTCRFGSCDLAEN